MELDKLWDKREFPKSPEVQFRFEPLSSDVHPEVVTTSYQFEVKASDTDTGNGVFSIVVVYSLQYSLGELAVPSSDDLVLLAQEFSKINGPVHVWPYVRELVSSMTVRMGFPALVIPSYKVNI